MEIIQAENNRSLEFTSEEKKDAKSRFIIALNKFLHLIWRDKSGLIGLTIFILIVLMALFAPFLAPYDPLEQSLKVSKQPPFWSEGGNLNHILGTDALGRDILSRIIYGSRVSILVGFFGVSMAFSSGMLIGMIAGYKGGLIDDTVTALTNLMLALPYLVFVVFVATVVGRSLINVILIFGITNIPIFVRITRGEVLRIREAGYIEAARSIGQRTSVIVSRHIMPNLIGPLITLGTFEMSAMILYEAGLGFLGLSVPPYIPSWGNMLAEGRQHLRQYPWISIFPGMAIVLTGFGMNLFGDWLRDILDPKMRSLKK